MTRQQKTPAQRAQEAYSAATRAVERWAKKTEQLGAQHEAAKAEHAAAIARRD